MIEVHCHHDLETAAPFRAAINALNLAAARPDPFCTYEFIAHRLRIDSGRHPGATPRLWLLLAFEGGELVGYLPMKQRSDRVLGLRTSRLGLLTAHVADRPQLVARRDCEVAVSAACYAYLFDRRSEWGLLEFEQQDAQSPLLAPPDRAVGGAFRSRQWPNAANGVITVQWDSLQDYWAALSRKFRSNVGRQARALLSVGAAELLVSADPRALPAMFELYLGIESRSWKLHADAAISGDRRSMEHYVGLMDATQPMRLAILLLLVDGIPVAGMICGRFERGLHALHIVYDARLARLAPGSLALLLCMRMAIAEGYEYVNLLRGSGYYKMRWLAQMTPTHSVQVYRIASPLFWRRVIGDLWRGWRRRDVTPDAIGFNPARRAVAPAGGSSDGSLLAPALPRGFAERCAVLVASVRACDCEFLPAGALATAMPFNRPADPSRSARVRGVRSDGDVAGALVAPLA